AVVDVAVVMQVDVDQLVGRRLDQVGILEEEGVLVENLHESADALPRSIRLVVSEPRAQLVGRDAGDLVAGTVEASRQAAGAQLLDVIGVKLVEVRVSGEETPARQWTPIGGKLHALVNRAGCIEREVQEAGARRLGDLLVMEDLVEAGGAEPQGGSQRVIEADIEADIALRIEVR